MNEQTKADIHAAITILHKKGWTQGKFVGATSGKVCLVGALRMAIFGDPYGNGVRGSSERANRERWDRLSAAYEVIYDVTRCKPERFNDNKSTKRRHVFAALREAEARA